MGIAIFSDIHGNITALEAVLADIKGSKAVNEYWILGDMIALGPAPIAVLERLTALPNVRLIRGNTDRYVLHRCSPPANLCRSPSQPQKNTSIGRSRGHVCLDTGRG